MCKIKKIISLLMILTVIYMCVGTSVYGGISSNFPTDNGSITKVDNSVKKVWGTVTTVVQVLAFSAVIFAGLRYMFAAADQKADIKKGLSILFLGAVLVFASSTVVKFVINVANDVL